MGYFSDSFYHAKVLVYHGYTNVYSGPWRVEKTKIFLFSFQAIPLEPLDYYLFQSLIKNGNSLEDFERHRKVLCIERYKNLGDAILKLPEMSQKIVEQNGR